MSESKYHDNAIKKIDLENDIIELLLKGLSHSDIVLKLMSEFSFTAEAIDSAYATARKRLHESTLSELDQIIHTHTALYEKIYQYFDELDYLPGKLKAMKQKEALLGLHKEENIVEVNNTLNVEIEKEPDYDIEKLTIEEQGQLAKYLAKIQ